MASRCCCSCCCRCWLLLLLLLEYRVDTTGESALRRLDGVQLLLDSCLRLLLLELCVVEEIKTSGQGRYACLNTGQVGWPARSSTRTVPGPLESPGTRSARLRHKRELQQQTADEQRCRQQATEGEHDNTAAALTSANRLWRRRPAGVGSYMHLHCLLKLIEGRAMDIPGRRTAQRHCLL